MRNSVRCMYGTLILLMCAAPLCGQSYCQPEVDLQFGFGIGITNVSFGKLVRQSPPGEGYAKAGRFTVVKPGEDVPFSITSTLGTACDGQNVRVYIDFNQDFDFDDAGEEVMVLNQQGNLQDFEHSIRIPENAALGATVMRVMNKMMESCGHSSIDPCGTDPFNYHGEVEDYIIGIGNEEDFGIDVVEIAGDKEACEGEAIELTATVNVRGLPETDLTYRWLKDGIEVWDQWEATLSIDAASIDDAGLYQFEVADQVSGLKQRSEEFTFAISGDPVIESISEDMSVCPGSEVSLNITVTGETPSTTYQWQKDGVDIADATEKTLVLSSGEAGSYSVMVRNKCGESSSESINLTLLPETAITTQPAALPSVMNYNSQQELSVAASGPEDCNYQWRRNGTDIDGATQNSYLVNSKDLEDGQTYTFSAVVNCGCEDVESESRSVTMDFTTDVDDPLAADGGLLLQNYPNPFTVTTVFEFELPRAGAVQLTVRDVLGRSVALVLDEQRNAGQHRIEFTGGGLTPGMYMATLSFGDHSVSKHVTIVR